jgi:hypothetical protein
MQLLEFDKTGTTGFNFVFERDLKENETVIVKMPVVSANKRGINDIGWLSDGNIKLYGTLAKNPKSEKALWQEIRDNDEVNKVTSAIKIVNNGGACRIEMRAIFY